MMKKLLLLCCLLYSALYSQQLIIATGGKKGNYFKVGKDINKKIYNGKAKVINTQGSIENMLLVASGQADVALVQADALAMLETFYMSEGKTKNDLVDVVGKIYEETVHILVSEKSDITTIEQLHGKTIVSGGIASGTTLTATSIEQEYGIQFGRIRNTSTAKGIKLLKRNKIDALFYVTKSPSARLTKYKSFRMIEVFDDEQRNKYLKNRVLPKKTYQFLDYDTRTYAVDTILIMRKGSREKHRLQEYLETLPEANTDTKDFDIEDIAHLPKPTFNIPQEIIKKYTRRYGNGALVRFNYLNKTIQKLQNKTIEEKLSKINFLINKISFTKDRNHWKKDDYWATPLETFGTSYADTEDMALLKYVLLLKVGLDSKNIQIVQKKIPFEYNGEIDDENIALLYIDSKNKQTTVLDYTSTNEPIYKYENQFKYNIIKDAQNPLWSCLFRKKITNKDLDNIMLALGEKH